MSDVGLQIRPTTSTQRAQARDDYLVVVHPDIARRLALQRFVVVCHRREDARELRVYGRLLVDPSVDVGAVCMDQTLRNALGIPYATEAGSRLPLSLHPVRLSLRNRLLDSLTWWLGRRYLFVRVAKLNPPDIEKGICRVPLDVLRLVGTVEGNRLVMVSCVPVGDGTYWLRNESVKAFELSREVLAERATRVKEDRGLGWQARYVDAEGLLDVAPDVAGVWLDAHLRETLALSPGDAIKIRRDFVDLFKSEAVEVGILFFVSLFALNEVISMPVHWLVLFAVAATALLLVLRMRGRVK